ncbi:hypothetical protein E2320_013623 [Naja naja]|nr:hypothetical protein E2320_013623 [Naja naja]
MAAAATGVPPPPTVAAVVLLPGYIIVRDEWPPPFPPIIYFNRDKLAHFLAQMWHPMECYGGNISGFTQWHPVWRAVLPDVYGPCTIAECRSWAIWTHSCRSYMDGLRIQWQPNMRNPGKQMVIEYIQDLCSLASHLDWPKCMLASDFRGGLNRELCQNCIPRGVPRNLQVWFQRGRDGPDRVPRAHYAG